MKITNRRAFHEYQIFEHFEAGINLLGSEVKAIRLGHADINGSHIRIIGSEAYLVNAKIYLYKYSRPEDYHESRTRKVLLHKKEILTLKSKIDGQNLTIIPISMYTTRTLIKLELALAKGKKQYQKREAIKQRDLERQVDEDTWG